jgi:hypothetical protein
VLEGVEEVIAKELLAITDVVDRVIFMHAEKGCQHTTTPSIIIQIQ